MSFWERIGFVKKKNYKLTPEELGDCLFAAACNTVSKDLENPTLNFLASTRATGNKNIFDIELLIVKMYAAMNVVLGHINSERIATRTLDSMNKTFVNHISNNFKTEDKHFLRQCLTERYKEYTEARKEKRGPNELWPLSQYILKNLLGKETLDEDTQDIQGIMALSIYYTGEVRFFNDFLKNIQIQS
jgi:hypothetical protein